MVMVLAKVRWCRTANRGLASWPFVTRSQRDTDSG